jgi:hypothetical protein
VWARSSYEDLLRKWMANRLDAQCNFYILPIAQHQPWRYKCWFLSFTLQQLQLFPHEFIFNPFDFAPKVNKLQKIILQICKVTFNNVMNFKNWGLLTTPHCTRRQTVSRPPSPSSPFPPHPSFRSFSLSESSLSHCTDVAKDASFS